MPTQNNKDKDQNSASPPEEMAIFEADILSARLCALEILDHIINQRQMLDQAIENNKIFLTLSVRDRAFVRMLVSTTLRRLGQIDDLVARAQERPDSLKSLSLRNILRLGACQLFFTEVPDHAAVDTSVRLAEHIGMDRQKGFVNGLLRGLIRNGKDWIAKQDPAALDCAVFAVENTMGAASTPLWTFTDRGVLVTCDADDWHDREHRIQDFIVAMTEAVLPFGGLTMGAGACGTLPSAMPSSFVPPSAPTPRTRASSKPAERADRSKGLMDSLSSTKGPHRTRTDHHRRPGLDIVTGGVTREITS